LTRGNFINLITPPKIMFRRKKSPTRIQEALKDGWFDNERGIIANLPYADVIGTSGQGGSLRVDYATLKKIFGKPSVDNKNGRGCKIRKEWIISIDGVICTIYDWKQGYDYTKPKGGMPLKESRWSVGGSHRISFRLVQGVIDSYVATGILPKVVRLNGNNEGW
jgi:hypothetical protein